MIDNRMTATNLMGVLRMVLRRLNIYKRVISLIGCDSVGDISFTTASDNNFRALALEMIKVRVVWRHMMVRG